MPSIFQQRLILIVFLAVIGAVVWWQQAGGMANYPVQKFSTTPVPEMVAELDFTSAEAAWSNLHIDPQGSLVIDSQTESALLEAITLLGDQPTEPQQARMALLLEKQFGPTASQQIMALLPALKHYKDIEQRWWEEKGSTNLTANKPPAYGELFQLQDELLGEELAKKMFSEQRRITNMMLATQQIQNDPSLTQAEKDQALQELQTTFQDTVQQESNQEGAQ